MAPVEVIDDIISSRRQPPSLQEGNRTGTLALAEGTGRMNVRNLNLIFLLAALLAACAAPSGPGG
ncbi:MAG TPA: hypothetical protein VGF36_06310, partial [Rhodopila sp.]